MSDIWLVLAAGLTGVALGICIAAFSIGRKQNNTRYAGEIEISEQPSGKIIYSLNLNCRPEDLIEQDKVTFRILGDRT